MAFPPRDVQLYVLVSCARSTRPESDGVFGDGKSATAIWVDNGKHAWRIQCYGLLHIFRSSSVEASLWLGLGVVALGGTLKMLWSITFSPEAGDSIIQIAIVAIGFTVLCLGYILENEQRKTCLRITIG